MRARRRAARARRADRRRRPQGRRLLGRHEAPARPRARARAPARGSSSSTSRRPASTRRAAPRCGRRSRGSRSDDGVTVFLTTQYLEEADVLADRVGIIDHGQIVAEGTPGGAEGRDRPPDASRSCPPTPSDATRTARACCERFGEPARASPTARRACGCTSGDGDLADVVRALDAEGIARRRPAAARADARRRLPRQDRPLARGRRRRGRDDAERGQPAREPSLSARSRPGRRARAAARCVRTLRQPAQRRSPPSSSR